MTTVGKFCGTCIATFVISSLGIMNYQRSMLAYFGFNVGFPLIVQASMNFLGSRGCWNNRCNTSQHSTSFSEGFEQRLHHVQS